MTLTYSITGRSLGNVAWAVASFERAYAVLLEDIARAERARNVGVPAVMAFLSGPYKGSVEYLLGTSLWMDIADVLVCYRTIADRAKLLKGLPRRHRSPLSQLEIEQELVLLESRTLPELGHEAVRRLADTVLHRSWHPEVARDLGFVLFWKGEEPKQVDLAEGDLLGSLSTLVEDTIRQVSTLISRFTESKDW